MALVEIVELKWLLAGMGLRLHVERLQSDPEYARRVLEVAQDSKNEALRKAAERVRRRLALDAA
ncbi:MAG: hypothetical protein JSR43_05250 [Proteobacteria bacterium]|mgnify:FL=1|jgi:hypothetical protein|nr:hypothetical protein [Pseudomonadota bacterium]